MSARTAIARWRALKHRWAWRLYFAGRMMELTRCDLRTGKRRADEALLINPAHIDQHPRDVADQRAMIYMKPLERS